jgi:uncharacterized membrane protein YidH (DUF202 family)
MKFFTKQNLKNKIKYLLALASLFLPLPAFAQSSNQVQAGLETGGLQPLFGSAGLTGAQSVSQLIVEVINIMLIFAGAIAVIFVIIGGYQYLTSAGNEETAEKGKKTLINAIIGVVLIIMSFVIINVIVNLVAGGLS